MKVIEGVKVVCVNCEQTMRRVKSGLIGEYHICDSCYCEIQVGKEDDK